MGDGAALFAGIDGGGTKTSVVIVDAGGTERGRATAGGSNYAAVGLETALANIRAAMAEALAAAGAPTGPDSGSPDAVGGLPDAHVVGGLPDADRDGGPALAAAWVGLAGIDRPTDRARFLPALNRLAATVEVGNDAELILSALPEARGVAVIAGTGSIVLGRDARGEIVRAGGWGHVFGDEGSGWEIGRRALQAAARASDGRGPATALLPGILAVWGLADPSEMIEQVYFRLEKADIARLASVVLTAAGEGDAIAASLLDEAAGELALGIGAVARKLTFPADAVPLALGGGLLCREPAFLDRLTQRLVGTVTVERVELVADPALTAARAARTLATG